MEEQFIRDRLSKLREEKQVSERKMSLDLGHSTSYIRGITSGRSLPSMSEFLYICEYLGITPSEFFKEEKETTLTQQKAIDYNQLFSLCRFLPSATLRTGSASAPESSNQSVFQYLYP